MAEAQSAATERNEALVGQFKEAFEGLRRQMDQNLLAVEKEFVRKDDFREFRDEYREDMRDLKKSIADITRTKQ